MSTALSSAHTRSMVGECEQQLAASSAESQGCLLQLPAAALDLVLQQLDALSLSNTAAVCSSLRHAFPAYVKRLAVRSSSSCGLERLVSRLGQHSSNLTRLSLYGSVPHAGNAPSLRGLPCSKLRQLRIMDLELQLEPADEASGVLHHCTGLTALTLERCWVQDLHAASAAVAALPELQRLRLQLIEGDNSDSDNDDYCGRQFPAFKYPLQLTHLSISYDHEYDSPYNYVARLSHLSALANLQHLDLSGLGRRGCPGGWPSQLVKLTCLRVMYDGSMYQQEQFQHLSCLTALKELAVLSPFCVGTHGFIGVQYLPQLTKLKLAVSIEVSTSSWACRTALQSLDVCSVHPRVLTAFTQLRTLALIHVRPQGGATPEDLLHAMSQLTLLTELRWHASWYRMGTAEPEVQPPSPAAFTALTASTNLCSLELSWSSSLVPQSPALFRPGIVYPHLHHIDMLGVHYHNKSGTTHNKAETTQQHRAVPAW